MHRTHSPNTTDCYHINIESRRENNYVLFSWNTCASKWCKRLLATEWCNLINEKRFNMDCEGFFLLLMLLWMSTRWWVCFFLSTFQAFIVVIPSFIPSVLQKSVWIRWCCALLPNMVLFPTCYFSAFQLLLLLFLILPDLSHIFGFFSLWQIHIAQYNELLFVDGLPRDEYIRKWPSNIAYTVQYIFACWLRHSNHDAAQNNTNLAANTNTNHNLFSNSSAATKTRWNEQFFSHLTFH